jgi:hypothetical protein
MMPRSVDVLFERVGKFLQPTVTETEVVYRTGKASTLPIRQGRCERTGLSGGVIDYEEKSPDTIIVPTLAKLAWVFAGQTFSDAPKPMRLTAGRLMAVTMDNTYSTVGFATRIPNFEVVDIATLLRSIVGKRCIFLAFSNRPSAVLHNALRWSLGDQLEVNGILNLVSVVVDNSTINLKKAAELVELLPRFEKEQDKKDFDRIHWSLLLDERSETENETLQKLIRKLQIDQGLLCAMYNTSREEFRLAMKMRPV